MQWGNLLNINRFGSNRDSKNVDFRSQFQRDYDRLIFSPEFRKMQAKTQVFPLPNDIFVHNRLTHSLEVACIGRSIAGLVSNHLFNNDIITSEQAAEIPTIVSTACLAHDIGNPPFGHSGEDTLSSYFSDGNGLLLKEHFSEQQWCDLIKFEGNANVLRLLTHRFHGRRTGGFALTYATLGAMIKYPHSSVAGFKKYGFFESETETFNTIVEACGLNNSSFVARHPLVYLVEAADDISYLIMDIEDAHRLAIIGIDTVYQYFIPFLDSNIALKDKFSKNSFHLSDAEKVAYLRSLVINLLVNNCASIFIENYRQIMDGIFKDSLANRLDSILKPALDHCKYLGINKIYSDSGVKRLEISGHKILSTLLDMYIDLVISPQKHFSKLLLSTIPPQYRPVGELYSDTRLVIDFLSSMTDIQAVKLYRELMGIDIPQRIDY